jgi:succinate-semialdehyde dehydrogenase/glutarate-semialdehyde dehydrogenase
MAIQSLNPATGKVVKTFEPLTDAQLDAKIALAAATFPKFRALSFQERGAMMNRAAEILERDKEALARVMTMEMGAPPWTRR